MGIYRNMLRTIQQVPDESDRKYLRDWARGEFKRNKNATDQVKSLYECVCLSITQQALRMFLSPHCETEVNISLSSRNASKGFVAFIDVM